MKDIRDIYQYVQKHNVVPKETCNKIIELSKGYDWTAHQWSNWKGREDPITFPDHNKELVVSHPQNYEVQEMLKVHVAPALKKYYENFPGARCNKYSVPRLNRYDENRIMKQHVDRITSIFDGKEKGVPVISILGALNDDYEGGEFVFNDTAPVRMKAGDVLIFPSTFIYRHEVKPVTRGTRYSWISWGY